MTWTFSITPNGRFTAHSTDLAANSFDFSAETLPLSQLDLDNLTIDAIEVHLDTDANAATRRVRVRWMRVSTVLLTQVALNTQLLGASQDYSFADRPVPVAGLLDLVSLEPLPRVPLQVVGADFIRVDAINKQVGDVFSRAVIHGRANHKGVSG